MSHYSDDTRDLYCEVSTSLMSNSGQKFVREWDW